ncbi:MAG: S8 family serine peptidase [Thermoanaerobaculia bacterium]
MHRGSIVVLASLFVFAFPLLGGTRYIVEFRDESRAGFERDAAGVEAVHARFRADLAGLEGNRATKTARPPRITREFSRLLSGAAVELEDRAILGRILQLPYVANAHPDRIVSADGSPSASESSAIWPAPAAGGRVVVVAVIDSGIDYTHPALGGGLGAGRRVLGGYDFVNEDADPMDDFRHGTHVAGIIGARSPGVTGHAPEVSLLAYKVLDAAGKGLQSDVIAALERAVDPNGDGDSSDRADVINLSLGSPGFPGDPVAKAADRATELGALVVAAVGNSGLDHDIASPAPRAGHVGSRDGG